MPESLRFAESSALESLAECSLLCGFELVRSLESLWEAADADAATAEAEASGNLEGEVSAAVPLLVVSAERSDVKLRLRGGGEALGGEPLAVLEEAA